MEPEDTIVGLLVDGIEYPELRRYGIDIEQFWLGEMFPMEDPIHIPYWDCDPVVFAPNILALVENWDQLSPMFNTGRLLLISRDKPPEMI